MLGRFAKPRLATWSRWATTFRDLHRRRKNRADLDPALGTRVTSGAKGGGPFQVLRRFHPGRSDGWCRGEEHRQARLVSGATAFQPITNVDGTSRRAIGGSRRRAECSRDAQAGVDGAALRMRLDAVPEWDGTCRGTQAWRDRNCCRSTESRPPRADSRRTGRCARGWTWGPKSPHRVHALVAIARLANPTPPQRSPTNAIPASESSGASPRGNRSTALGSWIARNGSRYR